MSTTTRSLRRTAAASFTAVTALTAAVAVPLTASAGGPAQGGCPPGFNEVLTASIPGFGQFYGYQSADLNGDGKSCVRPLNSPTELVFMDNVVPNGGA